jgi:hypothetical protein
MEPVGISPVDAGARAQSGEDMKIKTNIRAGSGANAGGVNAGGVSAGGANAGGANAGGVSAGGQNSKSINNTVVSISPIAATRCAGV